VDIPRLLISGGIISSSIDVTIQSGWLESIIVPSFSGGINYNIWALTEEGLWMVFENDIFSGEDFFFEYAGNVRIAKIRFVFTSSQAFDIERVVLNFRVDGSHTYAIRHTSELSYRYRIDLHGVEYYVEMLPAQQVAEVSATQRIPWNWMLYAILGLVMIVLKPLRKRWKASKRKV